MYFTNQDFLNAAGQAYEKGYISEEEYNYVFSRLSARVGIHGVNKCVTVGPNLYDYYFNSLVWSIMVGLGTGAAGYIIGLIPGLNAGVAAAIGTAVGAASDSLLNDNTGVIIRVRAIDTLVGTGPTPNYIYQFVSIRNQ